MTTNHFTLTQRRILDVLSDGEPHTRWELRRAAGDELMELNALNQHISRLRHKLPDEKTIVCVLVKRRICYRLVQLVSDGQSLGVRMSSIG